MRTWVQVENVTLVILISPLLQEQEHRFRKGKRHLSYSV
jgi:hypothetical protein